MRKVPDCQISNDAKRENYSTGSPGGSEFPAGVNGSEKDTYVEKN